MKVLVAYASKNGSARTCVERLREQLKKVDVTVADLCLEQPNVADYDIVIFGSSVRFGNMLPAARRFLKEQEPILLQKSLGLFLVCGLELEYDHYRDTFFSDKLLSHAFLTIYFGGSLRSKGLPLFDKIFLKSVRSGILEEGIDNGDYSPNMPCILPENVDRMASCVMTEIGNLAKKAQEKE